MATPSIPSEVNRATLIERLVRALILDRTLFEQVAADRTTLSQALGVVMLAGIANGMRFSASLGTVGVVIGMVVSIASWLVLSGIVLGVGYGVVRRGPMPVRPVATCLGFAQIPSVVNLLATVPMVGDYVRIVVWFWLLAATIVAARAAFGVGLARGILIGGLGFAGYFAVGIVLQIWAS